MSSRARPSSARPQAAKRLSTSSVSQREQDLVYECKAAYLVVVDDVDEELTSSQQLVQALQSSGRNPSKKLIKQYWPDNDELTFDQFVDICRKEKPTSEDELMKAFHQIDLNRDGYISNRELKKTLTQRGEKMTTEEVQAIIDEVDENKDGKLDYGEFCKMVLGTQDECRSMAIKQMEKKQQRRTKSSRGSESPVPSKKDNFEENTTDFGSQATMNGSTADIRNKDARTASDSPTKGVSDSDSDDIVIGASRTSLRSDVGSSKVGTSSSVSIMPPKPLPRQSRNHSSTGEYGKSSARGSKDSKEHSRPALAGRDLKLPKPKKLKDWQLSFSKGCFFFDDDDDCIVSHHYSLRLSQDSSVFITIEPYSIRQAGSLSSAREVGGAPTDTMLFILRDDGSLVTFTEQRDLQGKYGVRCDLEKGKYKLIPYTTGCRLQRRINEPSSEAKLIKKKDDKYILTKQFKDALSDIFDLCDLDGNGYLSRDEFNFFNLRTSAEGVVDSEWEVVEETVGLKNGEISREAFTALNQLEAEDGQGDTDDLWVTLSCMGFNRNLIMDEACPFNLEVYTESCEGRLKVEDLAKSGKEVDEAIIDATMGKGESSKVKQMKDLFLHTYITDSLASLVLDNRSHHKVTVELDCHRSKNCISNIKKLERHVTVPAKSAVVALQLMPVKETKNWTVHCQESVK